MRPELRLLCRRQIVDGPAGFNFRILIVGISKIDRAAPYGLLSGNYGDSALNYSEGSESPKQLDSAPSTT